MQTIISIDLETLGQDPSKCAIAAIGIAIAQADKGILFSEQFWIERESALEYGETDQPTMEWWAKQSPEAQRQINEGTLSIKEALEQIIDRFLRHSNRQRQRIVARAPSFDCAILDRHFKAAGLQTPWDYWQERDHRSIEDSYRQIIRQQGFNYPSYRHSMPVAHNALKDALNQLLYLQHIQLMATMLTR